MWFDKVLGCGIGWISRPLLSIFENCFLKKEVTILFTWKIDGIQGIWLLSRKDLSTDQYVLGLVDGSIIFFDNRE